MKLNTKQPLAAFFIDLQTTLIAEGFSVSDSKPLQSGLQVNLGHQGKVGLLRLYQSAKGITIDLSQIKDPDLKLQLEKVWGLYGLEEKDKALSTLAQPQELIGVDESGKGDYFGPLVVAGVFTSKEVYQHLAKLGVMDSKAILDARIFELADQISALCPASVVSIGNARYNSLYADMKNLNSLLAWGHARVIENVLEKVPTATLAISDQFANEAVVISKLMGKGRQIRLIQRPKAEQNVAVAAASIMARAGFLRGLKSLENQFGMPFPKGASLAVEAAASEFVKKNGKEALENVAKLHFVTTKKVVG